MIHATLAKANDLITWADRLDARSELPRVVRRLIQATSHGLVSSISLPADEGIQKAGWDGIVRVTSGNAWVPDGVSAWELGVNVDPTAKANDDYKKRTQNSLDLDISKSAYVFVTLRRWAGKDKWLRERNAENKWREVRAYDADDLTAWLEDSPSVHIWLSQMLGLQPDGALSLDTYWQEWTQATRPAFSCDLVIGGRQQAVESVIKWLKSEPQALTIQGDSPDEVLSFFSAVIHRMDEVDCAGYLPRIVIVDTESAWRSLGLITTQQLILIPRFDAGNLIGKVLLSGHHVLLPEGRTGGSVSKQIVLSRLNRNAVEKALAAMGVSEERLSSLATLARRSLTALRRKVAHAAAGLTPEWAKSTVDGRALLAPLIAGTWNDTLEGDREILARLAGNKYQTVLQDVLRMQLAPDPPFRRVGDMWMVASREDAWRLLGKYITNDDLQRYQETILDVLGDVDSAMNMSATDRFLAGLRLHHSGHLQEGIAASLAMMASLSDEVTFATGIKGTDVAERILRKLLNEKTDEKHWAYLAPCLPILAEAAPTPFLEAVEAGLRGDSPVLVGMFRDKDDYLFGGSSPHIHLLWALEGLAWNAEHLARSALCLAALTRLDPGARHGNRPASSLRDIFLCWLPHTGASLRKRLNVLDAMRERESKVAWRLMLALLPQHSSTVSPTHKPDWRDWVPESYRRASRREYYEATTAIIERLLDDAGTDISRWCSLIESAPELGDDQRESFLSRLEALDISEFTDGNKARLRDVLRKEISKHREFPEADWAIPSAHLERMEALYDRFLPSDLCIRHRWLFEQWVPLPELDRHNWKERDCCLLEIRTQALRDIIAYSGIEGAKAFGQTAPDAAIVGRVMGRSDLLEDQHDVFLSEYLAAPEPWRTQMVRGFVHECSWHIGQQWVNERLEVARSGAWAPEQWGEFLVSVPFGLIPVRDIDATPEEIQCYFWTRIEHVGLPDVPDEANKIIDRLLQFNRPDVAVDAIEWIKGKDADLVSPERIADVLEACLQIEITLLIQRNQSFVYHTAELFDYLESVNFDHDRLAQLELSYLRIHEIQRPPKVLHHELTVNPEFFVEALKLIYSPSKEEIEQSGSVSDTLLVDNVPNDNEVAVAHLVQDLLLHWHKVPGITEDGGIESKVLRAWVVRARQLACKAHRRVVADIYIGHVFAFSPTDPDGAWPNQAVRDLIEELASPEIESGWHTQIFNNRGVTMRMSTSGGDQERELAQRYRGYADQIGDLWPRTAAVLRNLADGYVRDAEQEDVNAELTQDMWR